MPLDEPSVPVPDMHLDELNLGQEQCLISEDVVVSAGPSTETTTSNLLLLPLGSDLDKLAFTVLSNLVICNLQGGPKPQFKVNQCQLDLASRLLFCLMSVSLQLSLSTASTISQQGIILPSVCQPSVQATNEISQPGVILPNVC